MNMRNTSIKLATIIFLAITAISLTFTWHYNTRSTKRYTTIANLVLVINCGEPVEILAVEFPSLWPGMRGNATLILRNQAPVKYIVYLAPSGVLSPLEVEAATHLEFQEHVIELEGESTMSVAIPLTLPSDAPVGLHEAVFSVYRGSRLKGLPIGELHIIAPAGETVKITRIEFPSLAPGERGEILIGLTNQSPVEYEIKLEVEKVIGPGGQGKWLDLNVTRMEFRVMPETSETISLTVYLDAAAPPGLYTIVVKLRRG